MYMRVGRNGVNTVWGNNMRFHTYKILLSFNTKGKTTDISLCCCGRGQSIHQVLLSSIAALLQQEQKDLGYISEDGNKVAPCP